MRKAIALFALLAFSSCASVLFVKDPKSRVYTDPSYESERAAFFFGLLQPDHDIYLDKVCLGKGVDQIATVYTAGDVFAGVITLGILTPRSFRVWCSL
jgi:hypothetical protein